MAELTIRVHIDGMTAEQLTDALRQTSTHQPMSEVEDALWVELNPYDSAARKRTFQADVDVYDWDVT